MSFMLLVVLLKSPFQMTFVINDIINIINMFVIKVTILMALMIFVNGISKVFVDHNEVAIGSHSWDSTGRSRFFSSYYVITYNKCAFDSKI